ncbi:MAG: outer membrane protein assembly factor BamE [Sphingomonadales bacterium]|nr:outer membrane protein assembly factor BamE [Sphingomonadales bacterium]
MALRFGNGKIRLAGALALGVAVLGASGCASIRDHRGYLVDQALVDSVQPGIDNKLSVERTLGRPTFVSQFGQPMWYYVAQDTKQVAFKRPGTIKQMVLRVRFDAQGNVAGIDKAGMEHVARLNPDHKFTPTLGKKRSFLEDLFGNIGAVGAAGMGGGPGAGGGAPGTGPNGS